MKSAETFLQRLKDTRKARNLTLDELSDLTQITSRTLYTYEQGKGQPRIGDVIKLAEALGTTVGYLVGESDVLDSGDTDIDVTHLVIRHRDRLEDAILKVLEKLHDDDWERLSKVRKSKEG
jgi:transcriptional regulator with XRE-family HTH domain